MMNSSLDEMMRVMVKESQHPDTEPKFNYDVIYAVGDDARIHVLSHGYIPDDLEEELYIIESEVTSSESPGVYRGRFEYDGGYSYEGIYDGEWIISSGKLLCIIPTIKDDSDE